MIDWRGKNEVGIRKDRRGVRNVVRAVRSNWSEDLDLISRALSRDSKASLRFLWAREWFWNQK